MSSGRRNLLAFGILMLGLFLLVASPSVCAAQSQTFAYINITGGWAPSGENISVMKNNWVELQGGVEVTILNLTFVYNGFNKASYKKDGRNIDITINVDENTDHEVEYPYTKHQFFYNDSTVVIKFDTSLSGTAYYNITETYPTKVKDIVDEVVDGDTASFRDLFFNYSTYGGTVDLPNGVITISNPEAGDYIMIVTDEPLSESDFEIISLTWIEVLEYKSELTAPPSIVQDEDLEVTMNITTSDSIPRRYGGALIKKGDYLNPHEIRLESNATKIGTELTVDDVSFVENWKIADVGLKNINAGTIEDKILDIIEEGEYRGTASYGDISTLTFTTEDLPPGTYILSVGVWQGSDKLVAFNQTEIEIVAPAPTPTPRRVGGRGPPPPPPPGVTEVSTTPEGEVTSSVTASSPDGKASATIPAGTIAKDAEGNPLTKVEVSSPSILPAAVPSGVVYVGKYAYKFGPTGATFNPAVAISIEFDPADFPEGTTPVIYTYEDGEWKALETTIVDNKAIAMVDHFSVFALFAAPPVAPPPVTPTPTVTPTVPPVTPTPTPPPPFPPIPMVVVIIAIVAVAIIVSVAYVVLRRKRE